MKLYVRFSPKADVCGALARVCFVPIADIRACGVESRHDLMPRAVANC